MYRDGFMTVNGSHILSRAPELLEMLSLRSRCSRFSSDQFCTADAQAFDCFAIDEVTL